MDRLAAFAGPVMISLATVAAIDGLAADRAPVSVLAQRRDTSRGAARRRIERLAAERLAGLAGRLDAAVVAP